MALDLRRRLDGETEERLKPLRDKFRHGQSFAVQDIFSAPSVPDSLKKESVFLHGARPQRLTTSIPFYETVLVATCPRCVLRNDRNSLIPLLSTEGVVPVLIAPYADYDEVFVKEIVKLPHVAAQEFRFYRTVSIVSHSESQVCEDCVEKYHTRLSKKLGDSKAAKELIDNFFAALVPFVEPDYELIIQFGSAIKERDTHRILQILELAQVLNVIRTSQAYETVQTVPFDRLRTLPNIEEVIAEFDVAPTGELRQIAADELGLLMPHEMPAEKYLEVVLPYRKQLTRIVGEIVEQSRNNTTKLVAIIGEINEEIRSLQQNKRFLAYRAIAGFAAGNSSIIGSLLVAGAMGLGGHLIGCGVSVAAGVGLKFASKLRPVKDNGRVRDFGRTVHASIQPAVANMLSRYIGISTRAVEVWQLKEQVIDGGRDRVRRMVKQARRGLSSRSDASAKTKKRSPSQ